MKTITYTRRSLACQYFPDAEPEQAVRRLTSWIRRCRPLPVSSWSTWANPRRT